MQEANLSLIHISKMQVMSEYFLKLPGDSQPRAYSEYEVR